MTRSSRIAVNVGGCVMFTDYVGKSYQPIVRRAERVVCQPLGRQSLGVEVEANPRSPRDLFEGKEHYEIPAFQRLYVWNEEDQWAPLWDDVVRVAECHIAFQLGQRTEKVPPHFLGAVVYETEPPVTGGVTRHKVIDGQQRMTTLQLLLDAVQEAVAATGNELLAEALEDLILNKQKAYVGQRERFKLWPSQTDRDAFVHAMDPQGDWHGGEHRILEAHAFFREEAQRWLSGKPDEEGELPPGDPTLRVQGLCAALTDYLVLVAIDLSGHDDAQLIFETLNDRGTPLLKADLIKNWVFRRGEQIGGDVDRWAVTHWADFDDTWWREEITQGRASRSRVDIFLQYWLTMRIRDEVKTDNAFRAFVDYAQPLMDTSESAEELLGELRKDADTYRSFANLDAATPQGRFHTRVIETMELAATTPVLLWLLSETNEIPADQVELALASVESWVIRRTLLRLTSKDVNRFMVAILKELDQVPASKAGQRVREYLSEQGADARFWPDDETFKRALPDIKMYGNIRQSRLRVVLAAVEQNLRDASDMYEAVPLPEGLSIEHVMPRGWLTHWNEPPLNPEEAARREWLVDTIGNLTLVTKSLNSALSNRPWTDESAVGLKDGGEPGKGKRTLLDAFSLLIMNKQIVQAHPGSWTEQDILARSGAVAQAICQVWPGPAEGRQASE